MFARQFERPKSIVTRLKSYCEYSLSLGRQQLLSNNVRCSLRAADAKIPDVDQPDRSIWTKGQLYEAIEVYSEVDATGFAVNIRVDVLQRCPTFLRAPTQRTKQIPLQVQQASSSCAQAGFKHDSARLIPIIGQLIRLDPGQGKVVRLLNEVN